MKGNSRCLLAAFVLVISSLNSHALAKAFPGDLTGDYKVDFEDLITLSDFWLSDSSLLAHWKLDESPGATIVSDSSVYGHDGITMGNPVWDPNGQFIGALTFDGIDDFVEITGYKGITHTHSRTISAWIKTSSTAGSIISWGQAVPSNKWFLRVYSGQLRIEVGGGYKISSTIVNDDNWNHVAAVLVDDGSPDVDEVKLYINGTEETVYSSVSSQAINTVSGTNVSIGAALFNYP